MSYFKYIITSFILLTVIAGCDTNIDYEGDPIDNFMVLNALVKADSAISCKISRSNTILEPNTIQGITDASIKLYKDGVFLQELTGNEKGNYYTNPKLKALVGSEYTVEVEHSKYKNIQATTKILEKPQVSVKSMEYDDYNIYYGGISCKLEITDPKGEDYYRLRLYVPKLDYDYENRTFELIEPIEYKYIYAATKDPVLNYNLVSNDDDNYNDTPPNRFQVFDDRLFDGEKYDLTFLITTGFDPEYADQALRDKFLKLIKLEVQRIGKDVFQYFTTVEAILYYEDSPFVEPVKVHSNVDGGAGIFGGVTSNVVYYEP